LLEGSHDVILLLDISDVLADNNNTTTATPEELLCRVIHGKRKFPQKMVVVHLTPSKANYTCGRKLPLLLQPARDLQILGVIIV
jgi:hypothetical protein